MNVVFAGTPVFARQALSDILEAGFAVPLVFTQPDRPAGRGMKLQASAVKQLALERGLKVEQPQGLRLNGRFTADAALARAALEAAQADVMVVAAYGLILPQWLLDMPNRGCINIHASLLPRWRGAAPIHRAIEAGDAQTGITIMQMDAGLDTGDMLSARAINIEREDTTATLHDRLAALGGAMVVEVLRRLQSGSMPRTTQPAHGITYAQKISKAEGRLDWSQPAETIRACVQAFSPFPGATLQLADETIKVLACEIDSTTPNQDKRWGQILAITSAGISVSCGKGALCLTRLQRAGGKPVSAADFARGTLVQVGMALGGQQVPPALREPLA